MNNGFAYESFFPPNSKVYAEGLHCSVLIGECYLLAHGDRHAVKYFLQRCQTFLNNQHRADRIIAILNHAAEAFYRPYMAFSIVVVQGQQGFALLNAEHQLYLYDKGRLASVRRIGKREQKVWTFSLAPNTLLLLFHRHLSEAVPVQELRRPLSYETTLKEKARDLVQRSAYWKPNKEAFIVVAQPYRLETSEQKGFWQQLWRPPNNTLVVAYGALFLILLLLVYARVYHPSWTKTNLFQMDTLLFDYADTIAAVKDTLSEEEHILSELQQARQDTITQYMRWVTDLSLEEVATLFCIPLQAITIIDSTETEYTVQVPIYRWHEVQEGETLYRIAKRYGIAIERLRTINRLEGSTIRSGQRLAIPLPDC